MSAKSLLQLGAIACLAVVSLATAAEAQWRRYDDGYYGNYYGNRQRARCLSSDGINHSLARSGLYPHALVGQGPGVLYMRVSRGPQYYVATVDGCTGRVIQMQPGYY